MPQESDGAWEDPISVDNNEMKLEHLCGCTMLESEISAS